MESLPFSTNAHPLQLQVQSHCFMNSLSSKLKPEFYHFRLLCTSSSVHPPQIPARPSSSGRKESGGAAKLKIAHSQLKDNWLASLSSPFPLGHDHPINGSRGDLNASSDCVIGVDPDVSGAVALLRTDYSVCSAQVYDSPHLQVLVGGRRRKRLDAKSIVQLLHSFNAPIGTTAYLEQSTPYPQDGKQDDSRRVASTLFPSLSPLLKRKKDHGRAEALLIAAYGKGLNMNLETPRVLQESIAS